MSGIRKLTSPKVFPTTEKVSARMRHMPRARTSAEDAFASILQSAGLKFVRNDGCQPGTPDFSFPDRGVAVFVDGDFWHGRLWFEEGRAPKVNTETWICKFRYNRRRDHEVDRQLRDNAWHVLRLWESEVRADPSRCIRRLKRLLTVERKSRRCTVSPDAMP